MAAAPPPPAVAADASIDCKAVSTAAPAAAPAAAAASGSTVDLGYVLLFAMSSDWHTRCGLCDTGTLFTPVCEL